MRRAAEEPRRLADEEAVARRRSRRTRCATSAIRSPASSPRPCSQAKDAAEAVEVDIDPLPAVTSRRRRGAATARRCSTTTCPATFRSTITTATPPRSRPPSPRPRMSRGLKLLNSRVVVNAMEPRAAVAAYDARAASPSMSAARACSACARKLADSARRRRQGVRVLTGTCRRLVRHEGACRFRNMSACCTPRARSGRPVKWTDERSGSFLSDSHGRDHEMRRPSWRWTRTARFLAVRLTGFGNMGAFLSPMGPLPGDDQHRQEHDQASIARR